MKWIRLLKAKVWKTEDWSPESGVFRFFALHMHVNTPAMKRIAYPINFLNSALDLHIEPSDDMFNAIESATLRI